MNEPLIKLDAARVDDLKKAYLVKWIEEKISTITDCELAIALHQDAYDKLGNGKSFSDAGKAKMSEIIKGKRDLERLWGYVEVAARELAALDPNLIDYDIPKPEKKDEPASPIIGAPKK